MAMKAGSSRLIGTSRVFPAPDPNAPPIIPTKIFSSSSIVEKMMLGCSGCSTLQDIVSLDLSNRRISTLDPSVFSRMSSLVDLNLTNNRLTGFPLSLGLRHLRKLVCDQNLLRSVQTLEQFPNLEELSIDSNELTVADQYIAVYMLPKLKVLNGKEVDLRETIMNMEETLQEQVHILWAESCAPLLKDPMSKAEIQMLETQFIELLKNQVQFGPDALKDFTHHMLTVLAEKCVRQMTAHLRKISEPNPTIAKVQIVVRNEPTPSKSASSMSNGVAGQAAKAAAAEKRLMQAQASISQEPASKKAKPIQNATPKAPKTPKTTAKRKMIEAQKKGAEPEPKENQEELMEVVLKQEEEVVSEPEVDMDIDDSQDSNQECGIAYEPVHLLRCHSVDNDPTDAKTNVWKCAFEPNPEVPGTSKWTVATCGSNQVCVIDCNSGKVLKKYQHSKDKEEFYCIAWTKLGIITETYRKPTTVLAAAGIRGSIKLLHTTQLMCYAELKVGGRARPVNCLLFHPQKPTWLFCGAEDIVVIDIGIPHGPDLKIRHKKLFMLEAPGRCLGLVICPKSNFLMAGCDNGCYGWSLDPPKGDRRKWDKAPSMEFLLPSKARIMGDEEERDDDGEKEGDMIDGLALLKDDLIASKVACDGSIHVWSLLQSKKQQKKSGTKEVTIDPLYTLEWCDSDSVYLDIGTWPGCGVLVSGDDQGEVWVYDVSKRNKKRSNKPVKPSQLLPWPENNEGDLSDLKPEEAEGAEKQEEEQKIVEIKDEARAEETAPQAQAGEAQGPSGVVEAAKDVETTAETSASAVANVLEEVVTKVVGEDGQEVVVVIREDGQVEAATDNQAVMEKEEEKLQENKEKVDAQQEGAVQKEGETEEVKDKEQKESETLEKAVTELAEQEQKEGEKVKVQEETEKEKVGEETEKEKVDEESEKEKVEEETEKEKEVSEEKEADTAAEKDTSDEQKEEAKAAAVESTPRRGQRKKIPSVKMEDYVKVEPGMTKKAEAKVGKREKRAPGRPKKPSTQEEEQKKMEKEKTKNELLALGIVRGRGRPRKFEQELPKISSKAVEKARQAVKLKQEKAAAREEKAAEKAKEKAQRAKDKAQLAEMRQSLKKPKKDLMEIANNEDRIIVNDVAISSDCKFIVSVTNKNLICVWQRV